ncbi:hypothetical protein Tco_0244346, partial [Tanacetum coccineum]
KDASKQRRIDAIDADKEITLVNVQDDANKEMFNMDALNGEEVFVAEQEVVEEVHDKVNVVEEVVEVINTAKLIIDAAQDSAAGDIVSTASAATIVIQNPRTKGVVIQELGESTTTISSQLSSQQSHDKSKGILIEHVKPMKKKDIIMLDEEAALKLEAEFNKEERLAREKDEK